MNYPGSVYIFKDFYYDQDSKGIWPYKCNKWKVVLEDLSGIDKQNQETHRATIATRVFIKRKMEK